jgi:hypothetical protein
VGPASRSFESQNKLSRGARWLLYAIALGAMLLQSMPGGEIQRQGCPQSQMRAGAAFAYGHCATQADSTSSAKAKRTIQSAIHVERNFGMMSETNPSHPGAARHGVSHFLYPMPLFDSLRYLRVRIQV